MQQLTQFEVKQLVALQDTAKQAAEMLRHQGYTGVADDLLLQSGFAVGLAIRGYKWPEVEPPSVPETDQGMDGDLG